ncbi:protein of unknown function [Rhodovastum atsumiense]|nr:protein of unknown function [Rhodovastum atsumiense]
MRRLRAEGLRPTDWPAPSGGRHGPVTAGRTLRRHRAMSSQSFGADTLLVFTFQVAEVAQDERWGAEPGPEGGRAADEGASGAVPARLWVARRTVRDRCHPDPGTRSAKPKRLLAGRPGLRRVA